jgi:DNA-binding MarR family transcriptional regulator
MGLLTERLPAESLTDRELAAWRGMLATHARVVAALDADLRAAHDLPLAHYEVLMQLADAPDRRLRMSELAERLLLSRSGLTRLVDRLEADGLVARVPCPDDARGAFAEITSAGVRRLKPARRTHLAGVRRRFTEHLDREQMDALAHAWRQIGVDG